MIQPKTRVRHPKCPDWGIGEVVRDEGNDGFLIFFLGTGLKRVSQRVACLEVVTGAEAASELLDNLHIAPEGSKARYTNLNELIRVFTSESNYAGGFRTERFEKVERGYKWKAHNLMVASLDAPTLDSLLAGGDYIEITARAKRVIGVTNLVNQFESMALSNGMKSEDGAATFAVALREILYGDGSLENRFDAWARALKRLGAYKWTIATYFPFMRFPAEYLYVKPEVTIDAAAVCGFEIYYRPELNFKTFGATQAFGRYLLNGLSSLQPRDMIDVQSFVWATPKMAAGRYWYEGEAH